MREIPSDLLSEWMAFSRLEPFGFLADTFGFGVVSSVIANVNRRKGSKIFSPEDFMPQEKVQKEKGSFIENLKNYFELNKSNVKENGKSKK